MTERKYEKISGKRFSKEQREMLKFQQFVDAKQKIFLKAMRHPKLLEQIEAIARTYKD